MPARSPDIVYRVDLGAPLPAPVYSRPDGSGDPWAIEHWLGSGVAVEFPGRATFRVGHSEVVLVRDEGGDPDLLLHLFLHHVLPRAVALRGDLMLHAAGAVSPSGSAYLFLATAGTGKSTLVTGLVSDGWLLLDDDGIRLTRGEGERFLAFPGSAHVGLLPDVAVTLGPGLEPGHPLAHGSQKLRFALDGEELRSADAPAPVASAYILERGGTETTASELSFAAAVGEIPRHGFHLAADPTLLPRQAFEHASALAAAAPVWRLLVPPGLDELHLARRLVIDRAAES